MDFIFGFEKFTKWFYNTIWCSSKANVTLCVSEETLKTRKNSEKSVKKKKNTVKYIEEHKIINYY